MKFILSLVIWFSFCLPANAQDASGDKFPKGSWLSEGYGLFVDLDKSDLRMYQLTGISCIAARTGEQEKSLSTESTTVFVSGHETFTIIHTSDPNILRLHSDGTASDIVLHRIAKPPEICARSTANTPQENYRIFWQTFAEQYPFFPLHKMDWRATDRKFRPMVTATTSPSQLFQIFRQMIEPLQDAHTGVEAEDIKQEFDGWRSDPNHLEAKDWTTAFSAIESKYVRGILQPYCRGRLQFGMLREGIGYLRVTTFYDYAGEGGYTAQLRCLQQGLDAMFSGAKKMSGLVIDVRLNKGGDDPLGIEIASRLTSKKYLAYTKAARKSTDLDVPLQLTESQPTWVQPSDRPGFRGNVNVLIGPDTVSAGETFTMALMGREPHVVRIGLNTQGVFSDVLNRRLPNGWRFDLPNEIYFTADGKAFDGNGIPPDVRVPFFSAKDLQIGQDTALDEAIRQLAK